MRRHLLILAPVLLTSACSFDSAVPVDGDHVPQIACGADTDCPPDWICNPTLGRCVPIAQRDGVAPALEGVPVLTPEIGSVGQGFALSFEVSEALGQEPVVELDIGGGRAASWVLDEGTTDREGLTYGFTYTASGSELEGTRLVTVDLVDMSGNAVANLSAGSLVLDFTRPRILAVDLDPVIARSGGVVHLSLELSESLPDPPRVTLVGDDGVSRSFAHLAASGTLGHNYSYSPTGQEPEGAYLVAATGADAAGNVLDEPQLGKLVLDFTPPVVTSTRVVPPLAAAGQRVLVEVELGEELVSWGALQAESAASGTMAHNYDEVSSTRSRLRFEHVVASGTDGHYALTLRDLVDLAGNATSAIVVGSVEYDSTPPALVGYQQSHTAALAADTVTVSFATSEALAAVPVVTLGGRSMARVGTATTPYAFQLQLAGTGLVGVQSVQVRLRDPVGNEALLQPGAVDVDAVPPVLVDVVFTPPAARLGITAVLSVTASEPLAAIPELAWEQPRGDPGFSYLAPSGLGHLWALEVTGSVSAGLYRVNQVTLIDLAGNVTVVDTSTGLALFDVDNVPPVLGTPTTDAVVYSAQTGHDTITLRFDGHDPLDGQPDRPLSTLQVRMAGQSFTCGAYQNNAPNYTCTYTVTGSEPEGLNIIAVRGVDGAGNETTVSAGVQLDFSAPTVVSTQLRPALAQLGDAVVLSLSTSEVLEVTPILAVGGPASPTFRHLAGSQYSFEHVVTASDIDGTYALSTELVDPVGNRSGSVNLGSFDLDAQVPQISNLATDAAVYSAQSGHNVIEVRFDVSESVDNGTLDVRLGDAALDCDGYQPGSPSYTCHLSVTGLEPEGLGIVSVWAADAAGNEGRASTSLQLDFTPPTAMGQASVAIRGQSCPLDPRGVVAAGPDAEIAVTFVVSEELAGGLPEDVRLASGVAQLAMDLSQSAGASYTYQVTLTPGVLPEGIAEVVVTLGDIAGNTQDLSLALNAPGVVVDTSPPAAPAVSTPDAVVYERVPWGVDADRDGMAEPRAFGIRAASGAVDADTRWVLVYDGDDPLTAAEIGRAVAASSTFAHIELVRADRSEVYLASYDAACNRSPLVRVRDATWTATLGFKVARSTAENPLVLTQSAHFTPTLTQEQGAETEPEQAQLPDVTSVDGETLPGQAMAGWSQRPGTMSPSARMWAPLVYDSARGKAVLFGGSGSAGVLQDVWEFDSATAAWSQRSATSLAPSARSAPAMAYDASRGRVVLFGGCAGMACRQDTWEWDGATGLWQDRTPAVPGPSLRQGAAMAWVPATGTVMMFGGSGYNSGSPVADTWWEWDGATGTWTDLTPPPGVGPAARVWAGLTWDRARQTLLLFGGLSGALPRDDLWAWSPVTRSWTPISATGDLPSARYGHGQVYDAARDRLVVFAGTTAMFSGQLQDLREFDPDSGVWTDLTPAQSPGTRYGPGMTYDPVREHVLTFGGGRSPGSWNAETWVHAGGSSPWLELTPTTPPPARQGHAVTYDPVHGVLVLFGGSDGSNLQDTWELDSTSGRWRDRTPSSGPNPPARSYASLVWDASRARPLLFGGSTGSTRLQDCWEWDTVTGTWTERTPSSGPIPAVRFRHAAAYQPSPPRVVVFGGSAGTGTLQDTWEWDGAAGQWTERPPLSPSIPTARLGHVMAYDPARDRVLLFGGGPDTASIWVPQTWEWNSGNGTWTQLSPPSSPPGRSGASLVYDPLRQRLLLAYGVGSFGSPWQDTWEWDGTAGTWSERIPVYARPMARLNHAMAFDTQRGRGVFIGGSSGGVAQADAWDWDGGAETRPALLLRVPLGVVDGANLGTMSATVYGGGSGAPGGIPATGSELLFWDQGEWLPVGANGDGVSAPSLIAWSTADSALLGRLAARSTLILALVPAAPAGTRDSEVALDYAEVSLRYRLP
ncbi:MAG: kelch repeat-containing protein [Pseudomonadota bacterium]